MIKVGLTGGIGSGKTTICNVFRQLGVPVYSADNEAKKVIQQDKVQTKLISRFGKEIYKKDGTIDSQKFASIIFANNEALNSANNIIHPAVNEDYNKWLSEHNSATYTIKEAAILVESGAYEFMDIIITVCAPIDVKIARVIKRDNTTAELVKQRMDKQLSDDEKLAVSDFVINNDDVQLVVPQVINIHNQIQKMQNICVFSND